jgi:hypothetical protein
MDHSKKGVKNLKKAVIGNSFVVGLWDVYAIIFE